LLRHRLHYPGGRAWTKSHRNWLASQKLEDAEHRIAFEEMLLAMRQAQERIERLEQAIRVAVPDRGSGATQLFGTTHWPPAAL
jgi:hypothetical protein